VVGHKRDRTADQVGNPLCRIYKTEKEDDSEERIVEPKSGTVTMEREVEPKSGTVTVENKADTVENKTLNFNSCWAYQPACAYFGNCLKDAKLGDTSDDEFRLFKPTRIRTQYHPDDSNKLVDKFTCEGRMLLSEYERNTCKICEDITDSDLERFGIQQTNVDYIACTEDSGYLLTNVVSCIRRPFSEDTGQSKGKPWSVKNFFHADRFTPIGTKRVTFHEDNWCEDPLPTESLEKDQLINKTFKSVKIVLEY